MMNKEEPYRDQAERLRQKIEKLNEEEKRSHLPPRSSVHQHKKKKIKWKLKYPMIRLLVLFFILLPVVSYSIYTLNQKDIKERTTTEEQRDDESVEEVQQSVEEVQLEAKNDEDKEDNLNEVELNAPLIEEKGNKEENMEKENKKDNVDEIEPSQNEMTPYESKGKGELSEKDQPKESFLYHKVQPQETLFRISMRYYKSGLGVEKIKQANGLKSNDIYVGQTLKIPLQ